ncbi:MAG: 30S ribosomal protein S6e [Candidatus Woesearchaeota archaeon]
MEIEQMAKLKIVLGDKSGKTKQIELDEQNSKSLIGKKILDTFKGELIDMPGYEFQITGGSDSSGFPMRRDVAGDRKKKILIVNGVGIAKNRPGERRRKMVAGNTIGDETAQVNVKVVKAGKTPLFEEPKEESTVEADEKKDE